jgi:hypothetical protein
VNDDDDPRALARSADRIGVPGQTGFSQSLAGKPTTRAEAEHLDTLSARQLADEVLPPRGF